MRITLHTAALALLASQALAEERAAFSRTVFIGDSLTDSGWFRPLLTPFFGETAADWGPFTTNPDPVWSQHLAARYGTNADSNGHGQAGDNYAIGSARVAGPLLTPPLTDQYQQYLTDNGGRAAPDALYTVWGGANDLFVSAVLIPLAPAIRRDAVAAQVGIIQDLQQRGARYVLVPNIPDIGLTPLFRALGPTISQWGTDLSRNYNQALYQQLGISGVRTIPMDTFGFLQEAVSDPARYGFSNVTGSACTPQVILQSIFCTPATYVTPDAPSTYLFADGVHPGGMAQRALADLAIAMLQGPQQMAALSQSAITLGQNRSRRVSAQVVPLLQESRQAQANGSADENNLLTWLDVRRDVETDRGESYYHGSGPALLGGLGLRYGDFSFGGFASFARERQDFGAQRGNFVQREATLGGWFGLVYGSGGWLSGQLAYSWLKYEVKRDIPLGPAVRRHKADIDARSLTAALDVGWDFHHDQLSHGPVASAAWQRVKLDSFAEDHPEQSSSLAYPKQSVDSLIGSIGWQFSYALQSGFTPYLRLAVEREFKTPPQEVWARAQSMPDTLAYAVPAPAYARNWRTATLGLRSQWGRLSADVGVSVSAAAKGQRRGLLFVSLGGAL